MTADHTDRWTCKKCGVTFTLHEFAQHVKADACRGQVIQTLGAPGRLSQTSMVLDPLDDDRDPECPMEFSESPEGYEARETWARRYDELNGAPEGEWDR